MKIFTVTLLILLFSERLGAAETCSREATISYQKILVDTNSTQKGEGLRFYIEKDPIALDHLDEYQKGTQVKWPNAILGTLGTTLILSGLIFNSSDSSRNSLFISGASMIAVNFLVAKTIAYKNEVHLQQAVEEYNKRNLPRIQFNPFIYEQGTPKKNPLFFINVNKDF